MTRPFFSRDRISHFELFDRHAGASPPPLSLSPLPHTSFLLLSPLFPSLVACLTTAYVDAEEALDRMGARFRAGHAVDFQVRLSVIPFSLLHNYIFVKSRLLGLLGKRHGADVLAICFAPGTLLLFRSPGHFLLFFSLPSCGALLLPCAQVEGGRLRPEASECLCCCLPYSGPMGRGVALSIERILGCMACACAREIGAVGLGVSVSHARHWHTSIAPARNIPIFILLRHSSLRCASGARRPV